jgi:bifunctional non-homologous end joining protein LigD
VPLPAKTPQVSFSNLGKVYFPGNGFTKGDMIRYYVDVASVMVPHFHDRPVTLIRMPDGVTGEKFYEKNAPGHTPDWVQTTRVSKTEGGAINYIMINDAHTLAWCANNGAIEFHPFLHRADDIHQPTHVAFDLDPGEGADLLTCIEVGYMVREVLSDLGLESYPKVSGSKGLQLYVPLNTPVTYEQVTPFAKTLAELLHRHNPDLMVSDMSKALRKNKVLIDWSQNH